MNKSTPKMMGVMQMMKESKGMGKMKQPMPNQGGMMGAVKRRLAKGR